jgi:hypothetical protein
MNNESGKVGRNLSWPISLYYIGNLSKEVRKVRETAQSNMSPAGFRKQYPLKDARMGQKRIAYRKQWESQKEKRSLGRYRHRW